MSGKDRMAKLHARRPDLKAADSALPEIHFGKADAKPLNWRKFQDEGADDDEELETTPPSVVAILGFDPKELDSQKE